jgi:hypothetical protein
MLRILLRMKEPFYIARQEEAPRLRERQAFLELVVNVSHKMLLPRRLVVEFLAALTYTRLMLMR